MTVLGEPDLPPFQAVALEMSGSGMRLRSPRPVPYQAAVRIEAGDLLLLGEVVRIEGDVIALKLQHSLSSLSDLHRLNQALCWENRNASRTEWNPDVSGRALDESKQRRG